MLHDDMIREWFRFADMDMLTAEHMYEVHPAPLEVICYHCHQVAEKMQKAYLLSMQIQPPKVHDLVRLCEMCMERNPAFREIGPLCGFLSQYGIQPRYPHDLQIDDGITRLCLKYAQQIKAFAPLVQLRNELE